MTHILDPKAQYDRKTNCYFGRVNIHINGKMIGYRVTRVARQVKDDALFDASLLATNLSVAGVNAPIDINDYM